MNYLEYSNSVSDRKKEWWLSEAGEGGIGRYFLMSTEFLFGMMKEYEIWMYLMSLNSTLKMVKKVSFMLHVFYHNFKNEKLELMKKIINIQMPKNMLTVHPLETTCVLNWISFLLSLCAHLGIKLLPAFPWGSLRLLQIRQWWGSLYLLHWSFKNSDLI